MLDVSKLNFFLSIASFFFFCYKNHNCQYKFYDIQVKSMYQAAFYTLRKNLTPLNIHTISLKLFTRIRIG